jgi:hypothetical protein
MVGRILLAFLTAWLLIGQPPAVGQAPPVIPADDGDLAALASAAASAEAIGGSCRPGGCSPVDCGHASLVEAVLFDTHITLVAMRAPLATARSFALAHFRAVASNLDRTELRQSDIERITILQNALLDTGRVFLSLASISDAVGELQDAVTKSLATPAANEAAFAAEPLKDWPHYVELLSGSIDNIDNLKTLLDTTLRSVTGTGVTAPKLVEGAATVNSVLLDAKSAIVRLRAGDWRGLRNVTQIVGKIGIYFAEERQKALLKELGDLQQIGAAELEAQTTAFLDYQRLGRRTDALETTIAAVERAMTAMAGCTRQCPEPAVEPPPTVARVPVWLGEYGAALLQFNRNIAILTRALRAAPEGAQRLQDSASLSARPIEVRGGETVTATFTAPLCLAPAAAVGLVPAGAAPGAAPMTRQTLGGRTGGTLDFAAPRRSGAYELLLYGIGGVVSDRAGFTVAAPRNEDFAGTWVSDGYACNGATSAQTVTVRVEGGRLVATKTTGNDCIAAGERSWTGRVDGGRIVGRGHVGRIVNGVKEVAWTSLTLEIVDWDTLRGPEGWGTFKRQ